MNEFKLSIAFMPRDKYSVSPDSLKSLMGELPIPSQVMIFDIGCPKQIRNQLMDIAQQLRSHHHVQFIEFDKYENSNKMWNIFVQMAKSDNMLSLENDVVMLPGCIDACLKAMENNKGDFIVPTVYENTVGNIHFNPSVSEIIKIKGGMIRSFLDRGRKDEVPLHGERYIKHLERHCFFIKKSTVEKIGEFDEEMHCRGDYDLSFTAFNLNLSIYMPSNSYVVFHPTPMGTDSDIFLKRWDVNLVKRSVERLIDKHKVYKFKVSTNHAENAVSNFLAEFGNE